MRLNFESCKFLLHIHMQSQNIFLIDESMCLCVNMNEGNIDEIMDNTLWTVESVECGGCP